VDKPTRSEEYALTPLVITVLLLAGCGARDPIRTVDILQSQGKLVAALQLAEKTLGVEPPAHPRYWEAALRKTQLLERLNRREEGLAWLRPLLDSHAAPADLAAALLREQAAMETALGRFTDADRHLSEAIHSVRNSRQSRMTAVLEVRRAYVLIELGRPEDAQQCLREAEGYEQESRDHSLDPYIWHYRGRALQASGHIEDAIQPIEASLRKFQEAKQAGLAANVMISLAQCYFLLGRFDQALALYKEALTLVDPEDRHLVLGHLGNMYWEQHDFATATRYYQQAAALAKNRKRDFEAKWLNNLATVLIDQQRWAEAETYNNEVLEVEKLFDSSEERAATLVNLGRIETNKANYPAAEQALRQVAESDGNDPHTLDAYSDLAELSIRRHRPDAAQAQFESALALADQARARLREDENKLSYLSHLIAVHQHYVDFLMDRGEPAAAFAVAESSRARLLRERLNLPPPKARSYSIAAYRAAANRSGATFLVYWIGPERSYMWAISGTQFGVYRLPPEGEISELVEKYQGGVERAGGMRPDAESAGARLFQLLLEQHPGVLKSGGKYFIIPDGPLYALNFETLPVPGDRMHFWIEDAVVAVAPSLDLLLGHPAVRPADRSLLLMGDAVEWNPQFPKLLYARQEMDGVQSYFPPAYRKVLAGLEATPAAYQRSHPAQYAYIHFAAHATANKNSPFDSAIILSEGNTGGKLSVKEVLSTPVNAELVTISACHSAGARTYWGEGLVGFAWAFLQSGARGVIAGLWDVSDYSSPRLMQNLYAGLAASEAPADALRAAKLELIHSGKYASPYYWGAFQLYEGAMAQDEKSKVKSDYP